MKKSVILLVFVFIGLTACEKADVTNIANTASTNQQLKTMVPSGEIFLLDGHTCWIDPEIVGEKIDSYSIYFEPCSLEGYKVTIEGHEGIVCPSPGNNCGRIYTLDSGSVQFIGLYLD